uniref:N-acetyl-D-glucosamine kinase n=1 Tax=Parascaris univalens TaxID=6257 RepID=A0A915CBH8_PARUN
MKQRLNVDNTGDRFIEAKLLIQNMLKAKVIRRMETQGVT